MDKSKVIPSDSEIAFGATDVALIGMTFIWGFNFIVVKTLLSEMSPMVFAALRFTLASLLFFAIVRVREGGFQIPRAAWGRVALIGIVGTTLYQPLFINGLALTQASNSSLILASTPAFIVLINRALGRERFAARGWIGIGLSFVGIAFIVAAGGTVEFNSSALAGDLLVLGATICWALYSVMAAPLLKRYSSLSVTALSTILGSIPLVFIATPALANQSWGAVSPSSWATLLYSATFAIVIAYLIWNRGIQRLGGARTAIYSNLTPVIATIGAGLFLNEPLTVAKVAGALVIFVGLYLARTANLVVEAEG